MEKFPFGTERAQKYILKNSQGMEVGLTNFGARIVDIKIPVSGEEVARNVSLGASSDQAYLATDSYPGASIVPVAGRISGAASQIKGQLYHFTENEPNRTLHSGVDTANEQYWQAELDQAANQVTFSLTLADGFNGFPGNVSVQAIYQLTEDNRLVVAYKAVSDQDTLFAPTNHVYFNLTGDFRQSVGQHRMTIAADRFAPLGQDNLPTGELLDVAGTPFDFRTEACFEQGFASEHPQNLLVKGYDHPWVLNSVERPVEVVSPDGKVRLQVETDQAAVVIYTYNYPNEELADFHAAFSLECQALPNACNQEGFGSVLLEKDTEYSYHTSYQFSWD